MTDIKTALITGASRGIGNAIARELKDNGYEVLGTATSDSGVKLIQDQGIGGYVLDLNSSNSLVNFWDQIEAENKNISVLINNAGITRDNIVLRMSDDEWSDIMNVHLKWYFSIMQKSPKNDAEK